MPRHLPPVYSPVSWGAIASSALSAGEASRDQLEELIRERFDAERVILTGSGTQALQIAITFAVAPGSTVALPAYSCYDLVSAATGAGARVAFYDIDADTLTPDLDDLEARAQEGVSAIVAGNLYGYPLPWSQIRRIATAHDALLIEDAAQGLGSVGEGMPSGRAGHLTVLSFGRGKGWTGGGGGALLVGEGLDVPPLELGPATPRIRPAVTSLAAWLLGRPSLYGLPASIPGLGLGETEYHPPSDPAAISAFSAALARRTADPALAAVVGRREQARRWLEAIRARDAEGRCVRPCLPVDGLESASGLRMPVRRSGRDDLGGSAWKRLRRLGVESGYPCPLPALRESSHLVTAGPRSFPGAEALASTLLTLPTHRWVREADIASALDILTDPNTG